ADGDFETILDITDRVKVAEIARFLNFESPPWLHLQPSDYTWYASYPDESRKRQEESRKRQDEFSDAEEENPATVTKISVFSINKRTMHADKNREVNLVSIANPTGAHVGGELKFLSDGTMLVGLGEGGREIPLYTSQ